MTEANVIDFIMVEQKQRGVSTCKYAKPVIGETFDEKIILHKKSLNRLICRSRPTRLKFPMVLKWGKRSKAFKMG